MIESLMVLAIGLLLIFFGEDHIEEPGPLVFMSLLGVLMASAGSILMIVGAVRGVF